MNNPNEQEPATPTTQWPPVSHEWASFKHQSLDSQDSPPADDTSEGGEESGNDDATTQLPSSPTQDNIKEEEGNFPLQVKLYQAALKGDWKTANSIFDNNPSAITMKISNEGETTLHVATIANQISFAENLVKLTPKSDLAAKTKTGFTALAFAAATGVVRMAKVMVDKNPDLPNLPGLRNRTTVFMAIYYKHKDMASFLYSKTNFEDLRTSEQTELLLATIFHDYYDIALDILIRKPELAKTRLHEDGDTALHVLARKPFAIGSSRELSFWKKHINSCIKGIYNKALMQTLGHQLVERIWNIVVTDLSQSEVNNLIETPSVLLLEAAAVGNVQLLMILIRSYPHLIWTINKDAKSIFHVAVENRQERVFSLIYEIGGVKDVLVNFYDEKKNFNMLHLAGKLAAPYHLNRVSGAALQMQRELLWFKEVEKIICSSHLEMKCKPLPELSREEIRTDPIDKLKPRELFSRQHKQLLKDGEEWMKTTANSCMLVATLIATVVFAAAFTVPGGNDDKDGTPIFRQNQAFTVFIISDVAALVLSTTSILTFLSILTSRYAEEDFLMSLPSKLLFGLMTMFVSIACMVVAFSATFFIAYDKTKVKIPLAIAAVAIIPIGCFCVFHFKLVVDILRSSYWFQFSLRKRKKRLF